MIEDLLDRSSWGLILFTTTIGSAAVTAVLVALLVAVLVGAVLWLHEQQQQQHPTARAITE